MHHTLESLIHLARARPAAPRDPLRRWVLVDILGQELRLIEGDPVEADADAAHAAARSAFTVRFHAPISTSAMGVGGQDGSNRTPPGWHRVHARIGAGAARGAIFESRVATGEVWRRPASPGDAATSDERDLILTRILTLEGLEDGVNRGPGVDSLARYIYIHGSNHEDELGLPRSHGCIRMSNEAVVRLFDLVLEGDCVAIVPDPRRLHFAGIAGTGMSALAQYAAMTHRSTSVVSGSDRGFDRGGSPALRTHLEDLGIVIHPQDGSGVGPDLGAVVVSTAVESQVPDVVAARAAGVPLLHRSELLADIVRGRRTIAVTGTSGKSTTVAMIFDILRSAGRDPSVITGGEIESLRARGYWGNAGAGHGDLLVIEADESDGSLVRYEPAIGVITNLQRDHREMDEVLAMFRIFAGRTREALVIGEDARFEELRGRDGAPLASHDTARIVFGLGAGAAVRADGIELLPDSSRFEVDGVPVHLPLPGRHNIENALAAMAAARAAGVPVDVAARALDAFAGVARRFESVGVARGIEVIDDFAHNPAKIAAALEAATRRARGRVLAIYQPHGYGPTRFLRADYIDAFARALRPVDRLWLLEIFYAGGTATRDLSSADIVRDIAARGAHAGFAPSPEALIAMIAAEARPGDVVLLMGARDPSLPGLAREILAGLAESPAKRSRGSVAS